MAPASESMGTLSERLIAAARRIAGRPEPVILMYHRVAHALVDPWGLAVAPDVFARQMEIFSAQRRLVPLDWLASQLRQGRRPRGVVAVTFDDGYLDILQHAKPILDRFDVPATVFVVSGALESSAGFWWDRLASTVFGATDLSGAVALGWLAPAERSQAALAARRNSHADVHLILWKSVKAMGQPARDAAVEEASVALQATAAPRAPVMSRADLATLTADGRITIGAHTVTHPSLPALSRADKRLEMEECRAALEDITNSRVRGFSYPFGDLDEESARLVEDAGFDYAVTTQAGMACVSRGSFRLPRFDVKSWSDVECRGFLESTVTLPGRRSRPTS